MKFLSFPVSVQETVKVTRRVRDPNHPRTLLNTVFPFVIPLVDQEEELLGRITLSEFQVIGWPHPMGKKCEVVISPECTLVGVMAISSYSTPKDGEDGPVFTCVCDYVYCV